MGFESEGESEELDEFGVGGMLRWLDPWRTLTTPAPRAAFAAAFAFGLRPLVLLAMLALDWAGWLALWGAPTISSNDC